MLGPGTGTGAAMLGLLSIISIVGGRGRIFFMVFIPFPLFSSSAEDKQIVLVWNKIRFKPPFLRHTLVFTNENSTSGQSAANRIYVTSGCLLMIAFMISADVRLLFGLLSNASTINVLKPIL